MKSCAANLSSADLLSASETRVSRLSAKAPSPAVICLGAGMTWILDDWACTDAPANSTSETIAICRRPVRVKVLRSIPQVLIGVISCFSQVVEKGADYLPAIHSEHKSFRGSNYKSFRVGTCLDKCLADKSAV